MNHFKYSISRPKLSNNGETVCEMMGTDHFMTLLWPFGCVTHSQFMNLQARGVTSNNNKHSVLKE